jgi:DNA-binding beta-propeller fold protein YncE
MGIGDITGDGKPENLEAGGWWERPAGARDGDTWRFNAFRFAAAPVQMYAIDIGGDRLNDVVTVDNSHGYGLLWWKQAKREDPISWQRNEVLTSKPVTSSPLLRISQLHALAVEDMNRGGLPDSITGKRFWAHGPDGALVRYFGQYGNNPQSMNCPEGIAVDHQGNYLIANTYNNRIVKFTGGGTPLSSWAEGSKLWLPCAIAVDGSGNAFVADTMNNQLVIFNHMEMG